MLDRDGRSDAARRLRAVAGLRDSADAARSRELADELEAEPEGYDYEAAAAARGEALAGLIAAVKAIPYGGPTEAERRALREQLALADIIMEGVERTHALVPVGELIPLANAADTYSYHCEGETEQRWQQRAAAAHAAARGEQPEWPKP